MYRFFDFCIECDFPLPGLPTDCDESPAWSVTLAEDGLDENGFEWFYEWRSVRDTVLMAVARRGEDYLVDCLGVARFLICFDRRLIMAHPLEGCQQNTLAHLLLDQVLPRVVCHLGRPVLHASAVVLDDGRAIAFAGPSGRGKSTLAMAFYRAGYQLITDDCLLLERHADGVRAIPAYPSLRLWRDSLETLLEDEGPKTGRVVEMAHYTTKKQLLLKSEELAQADSRPQLAALFLLPEPSAEHASSAVRIVPARGNAALMALIEDTFSLDVVDRVAIARSFEVTGRLASVLDFHTLYFPREYQRLSQVIDNIRKFVLF
jgi:hypothetical protein